MRRTGRCRGCDQPKKAASVEQQLATTIESAAATAKEKAAERVLIYDEEGEKLWRHVLFGLGTIVGLLEGYTEQNVPGYPLTELQTLLKRVELLIRAHERKLDASSIAEVHAPSDEDHS